MVLDTAVSVGHRLVNFVVRVARTDPAVRDVLGGIARFEKLGPTYKPFVTDGADPWLSLSQRTLASLRANLPAIHWPAIDRLERLRSSPEWHAVMDIRGENAHRWRKEHEAVRGVDAQSGFAQNTYDHAGNPNGICVSATARRHVAGDGLTARTTEVALQAIPVVAGVLDATVAETVQNLATLTNGRMCLEIDAQGRSRKSHRQL